MQHFIYTASWRSLSFHCASRYRGALAIWHRQLCWCVWRLELDRAEPIALDHASTLHAAWIPTGIVAGLVTLFIARLSRHWALTSLHTLSKAADSCQCCTQACIRIQACCLTYQGFKAACWIVPGTHLHSRLDSALRIPPPSTFQSPLATSSNPRRTTITTMAALFESLDLGKAGEKIFYTQARTSSDEDEGSLSSDGLLRKDIQHSPKQRSILRHYAPWIVVHTVIVFIYSFVLYFVASSYASSRRLNGPGLVYSACKGPCGY